MQIGNLTAHRQIVPSTGMTVAVMSTSTAFQSPGGLGGVGLLVINNGAAEVRLAPGNDATATVGPHSVGAVRIPADSSVFFTSSEPIANAPWLAAYSTLGNATLKVFAANPGVVWLAPAPDLGADATAFPFDSTVPRPFVDAAAGGTFSGFSATGTTTLAVSTAAASTPVAGNGNVLKITNSGTAAVNFLVDPLGPTSPPVVGQSESVGAGGMLYLNFGTVAPNVLTAITQNGTATLTIVRGTATVT